MKAEMPTRLKRNPEESRAIDGTYGRQPLTANDAVCCADSGGRAKLRQCFTTLSFPSCITYRFFFLALCLHFPVPFPPSTASFLFFLFVCFPFGWFFFVFLFFVFFLFPGVGDLFGFFLGWVEGFLV